MTKSDNGWYKVEVNTCLHWKTIMEQHNCGRTAAYEAKKRGWVAVKRGRKWILKRGKQQHIR